MSAQHPPGNALLGVGDFGDTHSRMHGRMLLPGENVLAYGADRMGVADSTAAFVEAETAAGPGGKILVPKGTYVLDNWTPAEANDDMSLIGAGWGTVLKAKTAGSFVMTMGGLWHWRIADLTFDGTAGGVSKSANGLKIVATASSGSQLHTFDHVRFRNALKGVHVAQAGVQQADKNTYIGCQWGDSTTGIHIDSVNAQQQVFVNPTFDTCTTAVRITAGGLSFLGGQTQTCETAFLIDGGNVTEFALREFIDEGSFIVIDGRTAWPNHGVILEQSVLQGSNYNILQDVGGILHARACRFNVGHIVPTADDAVFIDEYNTYALGAAYAPVAGGNIRRHKRDVTGHFVYSNTAGVSTTTYSQIDATGGAVLGRSGSSLGFFGISPGTTRPTVSGSRGGNAAVGNLIDALEAMGLINDSTTG